MMLIVSLITVIYLLSRPPKKLRNTLVVVYITYFAVYIWMYHYTPEAFGKMVDGMERFMNSLQPYIKVQLGEQP